MAVWVWKDKSLVLRHCLSSRLATKNYVLRWWLGNECFVEIKPWKAKTDNILDRDPKKVVKDDFIIYEKIIWRFLFLAFNWNYLVNDKWRVVDAVISMGIDVAGDKRVVARKLGRKQTLQLTLTTMQFQLLIKTSSLHLIEFYVRSR